MYVCTDIHTYVHAHPRTHTGMHTYVRTHTHIHIPRSYRLELRAWNTTSNLPRRVKEASWVLQSGGGGVGWPCTRDQYKHIITASLNKHLSTVGGSSIPARQQAENLADISTRMFRSSSGRRLMMINEWWILALKKTRALWSKCQQGFQPVF